MSANAHPSPVHPTLHPKAEGAKGKKQGFNDNERNHQVHCSFLFQCQPCRSETMVRELTV